MPEPLPALVSLAEAARHTDDMVRDLERLVLIESPTSELGATKRGAEAVAELGTKLTGAMAERIERDGRTHLRWRFGDGDKVLLLGHQDTVWPIGTLEEHPWRVTNGLAYGPGSFDMKAGLVQMFHALALLPSLDGVTVLVTADEEFGAPSSRELIQDEARRVAACLVLEGSAPGGALKTARKGASSFEVVAHGRAAHAGLEPWNGVNATVELAHQVGLIAGLGDGTDDNPHATTVTPTVITGGTSGNTVPERTSLRVDVRAPTVAEQHRVHDAMHSLAPHLGGASLEVIDGSSHTPMEPSASAELFKLAEDVAATLGLEPLGSASVGGASDGNITAGAGTSTLDGLGAVGANAHAPGEHVVIDQMPARAALLAALIARLTAHTS